MKGLIRAGATVEECEIIFKAIEHVFLCRHIILNICIMGMFRTKTSQGKGKQLKSWVDKLQANINLSSSVIDVPLKQLDIRSIESFTSAVRTGIKKFQVQLLDLDAVPKKK